MSEDGMSAAEEFARVIEDFTASDKERQLRVSRDSFRDGYKRCQTELETARCTIAEQEKRIAELEEKVTFWQGEAGRWAGGFGTERQRREAAETFARALAQGWASYGKTEGNKLSLLRGTLGIWHFSEAANYFAKYEASNG